MKFGYHGSARIAPILFACVRELVMKVCTWAFLILSVSCSGMMSTFWSTRSAASSRRSRIYGEKVPPKRNTRTHERFWAFLYKTAHYVYLHRLYTCGNTYHGLDTIHKQNHILIFKCGEQVKWYMEQCYSRRSATSSRRCRLLAADPWVSNLDYTTSIYNIQASDKLWYGCTQTVFR